MPLPGVTLRADPDRAQVHQFLQELRLPLATMESLLEAVRGLAVPAPVQLALDAVRGHASHLRALCSDFCVLGWLEQDELHPEPDVWPLRTWLESTTLRQQVAAGDLGIDLSIEFRSFLPSDVVFDGGMVERALGAALAAAMHRSLPGALVLRIGYRRNNHDVGGGRLWFDWHTRGGGFGEFEQSHVFRPFRVRDASERPHLGLTVAHRMAELLGGDLAVSSDGAASCAYRLQVPAPPAAGAVWLDPLAPGTHFGPVNGGTVVFVGEAQRCLADCAAGLQRAGFDAVGVPGVEEVLVRVAADPRSCSAILLAGGGVELPALRRRFAELGIPAVLVAVGEVAVAGADATLAAPIATAALLAALRRGAAYSDSRNATSAS